MTSETMMVLEAVLKNDPEVDTGAKIRDSVGLQKTNASPGNDPTENRVPAP